MGVINHQRVYLVDGAPRPFYHRKDAEGYCVDNGIPKKAIDAFDSVAEYERWLELQSMKEAGKVTELRRQVVYELVPKQTGKRRSGSKNVVVYHVEDKTFNSRKEAYAWCAMNGIPRKYVVRYEDIVPTYREVKLEDSIVYTADFVYRDERGVEIVEDVKSRRTRMERDYIIRRKLMLYLKKIRIYENIYDRDRKEDASTESED